MNISSRTPEGSPQQCPVCGHVVCLEPSPDALDAPCPHCGQLLWFADVLVSLLVYESAFNVNPEEIEAFIRELKDVVEKSTHPRVLLDLSQMQTLNSPMLSLLLLLEKQFRQKNGIVVICVTDAELQRVFRLTKFDRLIQIVRSREEALGYFQVEDSGNSNSLTAIYHKLEKGDEVAANQLWQECYPTLLRNAQKHLKGVPQKMAGPEDVALSAFASFIKAAQLGRFPDFKDRDDLWRLLFTLTKRKAINLRRYEGRRKVSSESIFQSADNEKAGIQDISGELSEEASAALLSESLEELLALLAPELRPYAVAKLEGKTNREIAEELAVALRRVERKLHLIRRIWMEHRD